MANRHKSDLEHLLSVPWWIGVVAGLVAYGLVGWVFPLVLSDENTYADVASAMQIPALLSLGVCLTASAAITWRARHLRRKFVARNGLSDVRRLGRREFQAKVEEAFKRRGYEVREQRYRGVDLTLMKDGRRYFVRYKQWKVFNIGLNLLVDLHASMTAEAAAGGFFISSGVFTRDARVFAAEVNIELVGGISLQGFLETDEAPTTQPRYREPVFLSSTALTIPVCPSCGNPMVRRVAKFGKTAGEEFWGCGQYPHCRGTR